MKTERPGGNDPAENAHGRIDVCDMRQPSHPVIGDSAMIPLSMPAR